MVAWLGEINSIAESFEKLTHHYHHHHHCGNFHIILPPVLSLRSFRKRKFFLISAAAFHAFQWRCAETETSRWFSREFFQLSYFNEEAWDFHSLLHFLVSPFHDFVIFNKFLSSDIVDGSLLVDLCASKASWIMNAKIMKMNRDVEIKEESALGEGENWNGKVKKKLEQHPIWLASIPHFYSLFLRISLVLIFTAMRIIMDFLGEIYFLASRSNRVSVARWILDIVLWRLTEIRRH